MDSPFLMIPGPTQASDEVLSWMGKPLIAHYGDEWVEIFNETRGLVQQVFRTTADVFMIPGSGTTGLEMGIRSCFGAEDRLVVVINGPFGENLAKIARLNGIQVERAEVPWGEPVCLEAVDQVVVRSHAAGILCAHVDTAVGMRNPVREIADIARRRDAVLLVDAVSSLGGEELAVDDWGVDICAAAVQKSLATPPGLAVVSVSAKAWRAMESRKEEHKGWYFDLLNWRKVSQEMADWHPHPATMPVSIVLALRQSLKEILGEGLENTIRRHQEVATFVREGLDRLGFRVVAREHAANTVTTGYTPPGIEPDDILDFIRKRYNIQISKFLGKDAPKAIRVGHMGPAATIRSALPLLYGIEEFMRGRGLETTPPNGLLGTGRRPASVEAEGKG